jgi:hypothetical protein
MNVYLPAEWAERVSRLRLGVDPVDALNPGQTAGAPGSTLAVLVEKVPLPHPLPPHPDDTVGLPGLRRGRSGRFALRFGTPATDAVPRIAIRIVDPAERFVPRRLSVPVPDLAAVLAADDRPAKPSRTLRPVLFPGSGRLLPPGTTAMLGRAVWAVPAGEPVAWARIEAGLAGSGVVTWRAQADRRGEFVLVVGQLPRPAATSTTGVVDVDVTVFGRRPPAPAVPVDSPTRSRADPLWLLPVEPVGALDAGDPAEAGTGLPAGYTRSATRTQTLPRGRPVRPDPIVVT